MDIQVLNEKRCKVQSDLLIVPIFEGENFEHKCCKDLFDCAKNNYSFSGKYNEAVFIPTFDKIQSKTIMFAGLGKKEELTYNKVRVFASKIMQKAQSIKNVKTVAFSIDGIDEEIKIVAQNITEGALIGLYKFDKYKNDKDNKIEKLLLLSQMGNDNPVILKTDTDDEIKDLIERNEELAKCVKTAIITSRAVNNTRDLINEPAELITPQKLAQIASNIEGVETKVYGRDEVKEMGMGAFLAVGQGSRHEQQFIHMTYKPEGAKKGTLAIIGKGITFDSGGLDIKPASSMLEMKGDMAGAAAVISIMQVLPLLKPNVEVHAIVAACENMPASRSYKPGDVLTAMNGKTIEVDNTDAEGRLTLADALCYAENLKPDAIIDIATLTGACMVALGKVASGLLGNDEDLIENLQISAECSGEYLWEMPMYEEYFEDLKSDVADFKNSGSRYGGTSAAALFLKKFVKDTPWAHIDIAGTSILNKPLREFQKGATGVGVRTLLNYITNL
ncbi:MAG: leucyl aminopeptidase [Candidatus Gastranaerophilales bacterium]|nr:leucyl aminopeptidase [Candidatus Gastranaerophilales bacterium]